MMKKTKTESNVGPMSCMTISKVVTNTNHGTDLYIIYFTNELMLAVNDYSAFVTIRNGEELALKTGYLQKEDIIWVDVHAFRKDGSLTNIRCVPQCISGHHPVLTEKGWKNAEDIGEEDEVVQVG